MNRPLYIISPTPLSNYDNSVVYSFPLNYIVEWYFGGGTNKFRQHLVQLYAFSL